MEKRKDFLPYGLPFITEKEVEEVSNVIRSGWWSKGPKTMEFEKKFAEYVGAKHAIALNSCTAALHLALVAKGIGPGDEVITTSMSFTSTSNTILHAGATPVFADIDESTGLIDPAEIERHITPRTKAIVPVHYAGQACDMDAIHAIAEKHGLFVSEDAAHAVSATYKGQLIGGGEKCQAASFSFYATKNLATGEGGMLTTNDDELAERARVLSLHGMDRNAWNRYQKGGSWHYDVVAPGFKYNMTDIAAALGLCQLELLPQMQEIRERYAAIYDDAFSRLNAITLQRQVPYGRNARHLYYIRVQEDKLTIDRNEFIEKLSAYNIGTSVHFIPIHLHPYYQEHLGTKEGDYPKAEHFYSQIISLPLYPSMTEEDIKYVAMSVGEIAEKYAK